MLFKDILKYVEYKTEPCGKTESFVLMFKKIRRPLMQPVENFD